MITITIERAAQQALEFLDAEFGWSPGEAPRIDALRAALAQQDEPVLVQGELPPRYVARSPIQAEPAQDRHRACPTHCCPVHGCKYGHDDCPVAAGAVQPVYPRNNGCESCADEAEPLNLSDRAVQRRLAAQWGYVHEAQQAEPAQEPVAWMFELARNFNLEGYGGWEKRITEYRPNTPEGSVRNVTPLYTAPPQRKPLTEEEIDRLWRDPQQGYWDYRKFARAVERKVRGE